MFEKGIPGGGTSMKIWFIPESQHFCIWKFILWKYLSCLQRFRFKDISVQFSRLVLSDYLWPNGWQYARPPCPLPTPRVYSNSCPLSSRCHPIISTSVIHYSSCLQSFPESVSFQMSQFFSSGGQSIRVQLQSFQMNIQDYFPLGWASWISLQSKGLSRVFSNTTVQKPQFFGTQLSL